MTSRITELRTAIADALEGADGLGADVNVYASDMPVIKTPAAVIAENNPWLSTEENERGFSIRTISHRILLAQAPSLNEQAVAKFEDWIDALPGLMSGVVSPAGMGTPEIVAITARSDVNYANTQVVAVVVEITTIDQTC